MLEAWSPEGLLDGEEPSDADLLAAAGARADAAPVDPASLATLLRVPPTLATAIAADPGTTLHAALHAACLPLAGAAFARVAAASARGAWLTGGDADAALAAAARGPLLAVRYTPTSPDGWRALAAMHAAAADALLSDAAHAPVRWGGRRARARAARVPRHARPPGGPGVASDGGGGGVARRPLQTQLLALSPSLPRPATRPPRRAARATRTRRAPR